MADLGATPARGGPGAEESSSAPRFSSADLVAGALFVALGLAFALGSLQYERGTLLKMGPGYVPLTLGVVSLLIHRRPAAWLRWLTRGRAGLLRARRPRANRAARSV